jgi:hypothetical protein
VILNVDVDVDAPVSVAAGVIGNAPVSVVLPVDSTIPISLGLRVHGERSRPRGRRQRRAESRASTGLITSTVRVVLPVDSEEQNPGRPRGSITSTVRVVLPVDSEEQSPERPRA